MTIYGYASVFLTPDKIGDIVAPGAFASTLDQPQPIRMLSRHDCDQEIGEWVNIEEDSIGLRVIGQVHGELQVDLVGLSIGFRPVRYSYRNSDGTGGRILREVKLAEISLVSDPCLPCARLHVLPPKCPAHELTRCASVTSNPY